MAAENCIMVILYEGRATSQSRDCRCHGKRNGSRVSQTVSVGICAFNEEARITVSLDSLAEQSIPPGFELAEILVVASGCTDGTERAVEERAESDPRIKLIRESERRGKVSALNCILAIYTGDILVIFNADARLLAGSLESILSPFLHDRTISIACGSPVPDAAQGEIRGLAAGLLWRLHNRTLETLTNLGLDSHSCDELLALRRGFVQALPPDLVNEGAYLGALAALRHQPSKFCPGARVLVETPSNLLGLLRQRRRIIFSHRQIETLVSQRSYTLRELSRRRPDLSAAILVDEVLRAPGDLFVFLFVALPLEIIASLLALLDHTRGFPYQPAWPVVE